MSFLFIDAQGVSHSFGARVLLDAVELRVHGSDRIALVGANGSGKSTLLRILTGEEAADGGTVTRHGSVTHLPQLVTTPKLTAREAILERIGVAAAVRELDRQTKALEGGDLAAIAAHAAALERWLALGGEDAEARLLAAAAELGLAARLLDRPLATLSGGQASRAGLVAAHVARCDVLLLDEPTNHLDADGLARLRSLLAEHGGAVVLVTHYRSLLADFADSVVELAGGKATRYAGGWEAFQRERADARARAVREYEQAVAERDRLAAVDSEIRRRAGASAGRVDPRRSPDGDKHGREWVRMSADGMRQRAARLASRREQVETPDKPIEPARLSLELSAAERRGGTALDNSIAEWEAAYRSLVLGVRVLVEAVLPGMRGRGWGRIVNIGSSSTVEPIPSLTLSNANRLAAIGFRKTLSREVAGDGITVNTIAAGKFGTDRLAENEGSLEKAEQKARETVPAARLGLPEEFGDLVAFLASYVTGTTIPIDGGLLRSI